MVDEMTSRVAGRGREHSERSDPSYGAWSGGFQRKNRC
jgi:hypothetical protein